MRLRVTPARQPLAGCVAAPGDKSVSHRCAILGGLAPGRTHIENFLCADDTLATLEAMRALGAVVRRDGNRVEIDGGRLAPPRHPLDLGNSGTGIRLLTGALAGHPALIGTPLQLIGDVSLSRRPMRRVTAPLATMGARIESDDGHAPLTITPAPLHAARHSLEIASAQVKSALLLAGLFAAGTTRVHEPAPSRDHTERLLPAFGVAPERGAGEVFVSGPAALTPASVVVPGDLSSAAFLIAAALLVKDSRIQITQVGVNPTRDGVLRILELMAPGAVGRADADGAAGAEPVADLEVGAAALSGVAVPAEWVPLAIDEFPVVMALAAAAEGRTEIRGAAELRVKESDRLAVMCTELARLGVRVEQQPDGAVVTGGPVRGGRVDAGGDHRIAMSLAVLGLGAEDVVEIDGAEWLRTSYPDFVADLTRLGGVLKWC